MISHKTDKFQKLFDRLPENIKRKTRKAYKLFTQDPYHPNLNFKRIRHAPNTYSVKIDDNYRAIGVRDGEEILWIFVGSHSGYDGFISQL